MKNLILIFAFLISIPVFSQQDTTNINTLQISEVERIFDKYSEKVYNGFSEAVDSVTPAAKEGFSYVVKIQIAKGIVSLLPIIVLFISLFLFIKEYRKIENVLKSNNVPSYMCSNTGPFNDSNASPFLIIPFITTILFFTISMFTTYRGVLLLMAPEWFALQEILNLVK